MVHALHCPAPGPPPRSPSRAPQHLTGAENAPTRSHLLSGGVPVVLKAGIRQHKPVLLPLRRRGKNEQGERGCGAGDDKTGGV